MPCESFLREGLLPRPFPGGRCVGAARWRCADRPGRPGPVPAARARCARFPGPDRTGAAASCCPWLAGDAFPRCSPVPLHSACSVLPLVVVKRGAAWWTRGSGRPPLGRGLVVFRDRGGGGEDVAGFIRHQEIAMANLDGSGIFADE